MKQNEKIIRNEVGGGEFAVIIKTKHCSYMVYEQLLMKK